ncbi:MAG: hypothetical protein LBM77_07025 [Spirochaetaceae bacterium]|jgi:hypothetical protein|nr:hypothetical protein [Spirochaetaceae bacterium]
MKNKLLPVIALLLLSLLSGCFSTPAPAPAAVTPDELDDAIREASDYLNENIPQGSQVAILNVNSGSTALSEYIIDELIANIVNDKVLTIVDRQQLDAIRAEQNIGLSGEVDDATAAEIGKFIGAQTIVTGAVSQFGDLYRMRIRAMEVQTAQVQGQYNRNIPSGPTITALVNSKDSGYGDGALASGTANVAPATKAAEPAVETQKVEETKPAAATAQAAAPAAEPVKTYKIGDTGPAGGIIFYDKGNKSSGWQYMEAAPEETERQVVWGGDWRNEVKGTKTDVGTGKENTRLIVDSFTNNGLTGAATQCEDLIFNNFDDWFLPSTGELSLIYRMLKSNNLGNFRNDKYWSSSDWNGDTRTYYINFADGIRGGAERENVLYVRPIRQF